MKILEIKKLLKQADELLYLNDITGAEKILKRVYELDDQNPEYYYLIGEVYCKQRLFHKSVQVLKKALFYLPDHPKVLQLLGWATFMNGKATEGKELLLKALLQLPDDSSVLCDLAVVEMQKGDMDKAIIYAKKAIKINPKDQQARDALRASLVFKAAKLKFRNRVD